MATQQRLAFWSFTLTQQLSWLWQSLKLFTNFSRHGFQLLKPVLKTFKSHLTRFLLHLIERIRCDLKCLKDWLLATVWLMEYETYLTFHHNFTVGVCGRMFVCVCVCARGNANFRGTQYTLHTCGGHFLIGFQLVEDPLTWGSYHACLKVKRACVCVCACWGPSSAQAPSWVASVILSSQPPPPPKGLRVGHDMNLPNCLTFSIFLFNFMPVNKQFAVKLILLYFIFNYLPKLRPTRIR